ncbi:hypothetical protein L198_01784 [Cryptococcus wingfieldii CBS 7118]|uniref:CASTOR ACT domain-containing protein n=1 Tax=Cryptococcus wingfieldii CBS 7118 TaxID=1295528 RepID=A0A1E3JY20_9TREE|nr:hypothetical protein L198_01784 [Cryptococcus wingfieldii CBS 7118]ODO05097.1 hypothetical protein L198_01784 [Cryptococcus wingfieldii CBS 7118]
MLDISITALEDPVAIVHIPIALTLADAYTSKIYWTLDAAERLSPEFFNITSNRIEASGSLLMAQEWAATADSEVLISPDWRVFEISSGDEDDVGNYDSPHLRHVSAPLARAGISILYQSSYFTDFLLVKESDFEKAAGIFSQEGWHVSPTAPSPRRPLPLPTPASSSFSSFSTSSSPSPTPSPQPEITVLPHPLACVGLSKTAEVRFAERLRKFLVWPERAVAVHSPVRDVSDDEDESEGEADELEDERRRLAPSRSARDLSPSQTHKRPFISYTRNEDGASLLTEIRILRAMFPAGEAGEEDHVQSGGELAWIDRDLGLDEAAADSGEEDDDWVEWEIQTPVDMQGAEVKELDGGVVEAFEKGHRKVLSLPCTPYEPLHVFHTHTHTQIDHKTQFIQTTQSIHSIDLASYSPGSISSNITATAIEPEVRVSFPTPSLLHAVELPIRWSGRKVKNEGKGKKRCLQMDLRSLSDAGHGDGEGIYHLDKSGLVTRFSSLLAGSSVKRPIRMLYSSTFHTANILVESRDVKRAKGLLERTRGSAEWA